MPAAPSGRWNTFSTAGNRRAGGSTRWLRPATAVQRPARTGDFSIRLYRTLVRVNTSARPPRQDGIKSRIAQPDLRRCLSSEDRLRGVFLIGGFRLSAIDPQPDEGDWPPALFPRSHRCRLPSRQRGAVDQEDAPGSASLGYPKVSAVTDSVPNIEIHDIGLAEPLTIAYETAFRRPISTASRASSDGKG